MTYRHRNSHVRKAAPAGSTANVLARRQFLKQSGLVLMTAGLTPAMLAACGSDDSASSPTAVASGGSLGGTLDFLSWEGYDLPKIMTPWLKENGVKLNPTYPSNHDEITAKLVGGGSAGYDILTYYQGYKDYYSDLGLLTPLDESKIPNLSGLLPFFGSDIGNYWVDPDGNRIGVPWTWSINALTYDSGAIDAPTSYMDLLDSSFNGKLSIVDDPLGAFTIGATILGYDVAELTPDQMAEVSDLLSQFVGQARSITPGYGDATTQLVSGEAIAVYPGWAAMSSFAGDAGKDTVATAIPEEGGMATVDAWAIPPNADNAETAYAWMNETLDPKIQAAAAAYLVAGTVVEAAVPLLDEANAAAYPYYDDLEGVFETVKLNGIPPQESDEFMTSKQMADEWTSIKANA